MREEALSVDVDVKYATLVKADENDEIFEVIEQWSTPFDPFKQRVRFRRMLPNVPEESYASGLLPLEVEHFGDIDVENWVRNGKMKIKMFVNGHDGEKAIKAEETVDTSADFALRCMRMGHGLPVDDDGFRALDRYVEVNGNQVFHENTLAALTEWRNTQAELAAQASNTEEG